MILHGLEDVRRVEDRRLLKSSHLGTLNEIFRIFVENVNVRVIARKTLKVFWVKHKDCEQQLKSWYDETVESVWLSPKDIKANYPSASFLADNRVVFNIKGNTYRLIVKINYKYKMVWIRFVGTHAEYDKINANKI